MANSTVPNSRLEVPLNMLRSRGEGVPNNLRDQRRAHGQVLRQAAAIAGYESDKEVAVALEISQSQLSEWYAGTENPQTWRFERHLRLGPALLLAQGQARAKDDSGVVVTTNISVRMGKGR